MAVGAGASLAIACDIQFASARSSVGFVFRNVGLTIDSATSYFLTQLVSTNIAKELVYTGKIIDAAEAEELGLVNHVYPDDSIDEEADELIENIAFGPTVALSESKRHIDQGANVTLEEARRNENVSQSLFLETEDYDEGVETFLEDRDPEFAGK